MSVVVAKRIYLWKRKNNDLYVGLRQAGIVMSIPMMLGAGPVIGYVIGYLLDQQFGTGWLYILMAFVGFAAGVNEAIRVIKIIERDSKKKK